MNLTEQKKEVFISLQEYIITFMSGLKEIINWFHQGNEQKALETMIDAVEGFEWICEALSVTSELHNVIIESDKINPLLIEINEGLERSDTILIADILEYEIMPIVKEWNSIVNKSNK